MDINISSQKNQIILAVVVLLALGGGYFFFMSTSSSAVTGEQPVDQSLLVNKVVTFLNTKDRIDLKDSSFLKSVYYSQLVDYSETIPMSTKRGRDNPFIPYVAPGSIR
jgi:hypothetical protein